ncbi:hypothetical protein CBR_g50986 [Chara braunii]|uniref:Uncharacterized protein n=1 Tax=Chara braunii TaxID=69332 RepID=A0A388M7W9_CHABU|nr:hypothetical protein CBR_g50986 [Chara braunii]|eukprot:GBG90640.1 hypothetical protein CBR_g50986 [Chara braunii]
MQRQIVAFRETRPSHRRSVESIFGRRATELRPYPEGGDTAPADAADDEADDEWTDDDDAPVSGDVTAERVYYTYGAGRDGAASYTSVITDDVPSGGRASAPSTEQASAMARHRPVDLAGGSGADVRVDDLGEHAPRQGLRSEGRPWEVRSDDEGDDEAWDEEEEVALQDRWFAPSHHPIAAPTEGPRRSARLASGAGGERTRDSVGRGERTPSDAGIQRGPGTQGEGMPSTGGGQRPHDSEGRGGISSPSDAGVRPRSQSQLRTDDFDMEGLGASLGDLSAQGRGCGSSAEVRTDDFILRGGVQSEERYARLDRQAEEQLERMPRWESLPAYLEEQRRQRELETGIQGGGDAEDPGHLGVHEEAVGEEFADEGQDADAGGRSSARRQGGAEIGGDEGEDDDVAGGSPPRGHATGESGGDGDTAGHEGDDGAEREDEQAEDDPYRLALVLRDARVPPLRSAAAGASTFYDADALAQALIDDPFLHMGRKSGKTRAPGRVYSPPPFVVQSPHWSGSSLSGARGRESGEAEVGSGKRNDRGRDSGGSMAPPPARATEEERHAGEETPAPGATHTRDSPPPVRGGVGGGWSAHRRVSDRLWGDYDAGRGVFAGRTSAQTQLAEGGSGRPSLQMAGHVLGMGRVVARRSLVIPIQTPGTSADIREGQRYSSGEEGLLMRPGERRHRGIEDVQTVEALEARLTADIAARQATLDALQREREEIAAQAAEDDDTGTESEAIETTVRRHRAAVAAAAAAAQAANINGAQGKGGGGRGGRTRGPPGHPPSGRGRAR